MNNTLSYNQRIKLASLCFNACREKRAAEKKVKEAEKQAGYWTEALGQLAAMAGGGAIGAGLGGLAGGPRGALGGGYLGSMLPAYGGVLGGGGAALATPTRNLKEQAEADQEGILMNMIPGRGQYNSLKRLGHSIRGPEISAARDALSPKKKEKEDDMSSVLGQVAGGGHDPETLQKIMELLGRSA